MGSSFSDVDTATQFRDYIEKVVTDKIKQLRPQARVAKVLDFNNDTLKARVQFSGDTGSVKASFGPSLRPKSTNALVRIAGSAGNYYITEILNESGSNADYDASILDINGTQLPAVNLRIDNAVTDYTAKYGATNTRIDDAINDYNSKINLKSKHTLSANAPTSSDANNAGDVWERYSATDSTKIIGRWRGAGGSGPSSYMWTVMNLDATYIPLLDIGSGTFGDLTGTRLQAASVGTNKLVISDLTNYVIDFNSSADRTGFPPAQNSAWDYNNTPGDGWRLKMNQMSPATGQWQITSIGNPWSVKPGDQYWLEFDYWRDVGNSMTVFALNMEGHDEAGNVVTYDIRVDINYGATLGTWQHASGSVTIPSGVYSVYPQAKIYENSGAPVYIRKPIIRRKAAGELIVDGSIYAKHVAANTIGVDKLIVSDFTNYVMDPRFTGANWGTVSGWSIGTGNAYIDTAYPNRFSVVDGCLIITNGAYTEVYSNPFTVIPGSMYSATVDAAPYSSPTGTWVARIAWYDKNGAYLSYSDIAGRDGPSMSGWGVYSGTVTAPTNAVTGRPHIIRYNDVSTGYYIFDNFQVRRKFGGELIVDGSIYATHIAAGSLSVDRLSVGLSGNLIDNGDAGETPSRQTTYPSASWWSYWSDSATGYGHSHSGTKMFLVNTPANPGWPYSAFAGQIPVQPGEVYTLSYWSKRWNNCNTPVAVQFFGYRGDGTYTGNPDIGSLATSTGDPNATWVQKTLQFTIPTDCYYITPTLSIRSGTVGTEVWFLDDIQLQKSVTGSMIVNGAIDGKTIRTSAAGSDYIELNASTNMISFVDGGTQTAYIQSVLNSGKRYLSIKVGSMNFNINSTDGVVVTGPLGCSGLLSSDGTYNNTVTATANVFIGAGHNLLRSTSLSKYKLDQKPIVLDDARSLRKLTPKSWYDSGDVERNDGKYTGLRRIPGLVAEDVEKYAPLFATYDDYDELTGVSYDRVGAALILLINELYDRIEALEGSV